MKADNANTVREVHCSHCGILNHKCAWDFLASGHAEVPSVQCWKCDATFDPNWEEQFEIDTLTSMAELHNEYRDNGSR